MGNLVGSCGTAVVPSEDAGASSSGGGGGGGKPPVGGAGDGGVEGGGGNKSAPERPDFKSELEGIHEPPTTITMVLSNALYAMEFHKHLALT